MSLKCSKINADQFILMRYGKIDPTKSMKIGIQQILMNPQYLFLISAKPEEW